MHLLTRPFTFNGMLTRVAWWLAALAASPILFLQAAEPSPGAKPRILATFLPAWCLAVNVAGNAADVESLLPPALGPHEHQFPPRDMRKLSEADVIILNGLGLDNWLKPALNAVGRKAGSRVVEMAGGLSHQLIPLRGGRQTSEAGNAPNPHVWLDPLLMAHAVTNLLEALSACAPAHREDYRRNAQAYLERLEHLDREILARVETANLRQKPFVTLHDAFPYFARRYGLDLAGVVEELPDVDPSPKQLKDLSQLIRTRNVKVLFIEPRSSNKLARQIARDLKMQVAELDTLETGQLTPAVYEESMRRNIQTLEKFLQ